MKPELLYLKLQKAIEEAPAIPPCQTTDPELWFGVNDRNDGQYQVSYTVAKQLCNSCPVQNLCAKYAIYANEPEGVWGGLSPKERQKMRAALGRTGYIRPRAKKYA
jgi:WhiB family redox-sensing transcriptional regulator